MTATSVDVSVPLSNPQRTGTAIFLVGFMGAGKTSVGRALADSLRWRFVDLDERIIARTERTVVEIFAQDGEAAFRQMEHNELRVLVGEVQSENTVVSLGGGAWTQPANVDLLQRSSLPVIFLDAPVEELWRRCAPEQGLRPLLKNEKGFRELYLTRRPSYLDGTLRVETHERSVEEVAQHITLLLGLAGNLRTT